MTLTITRKEACELIRSYVGKEEGPKDEDLNKIVFAVNNDYQVRDFILGLPEYYDMQEVVDFLSHMANEAPIIEDIPFITVAGALAYETDHLKDFYLNMGYVATHRPSYSLAKVLMRCAASSFPGKTLTGMRKELASSVMKVCYNETPDHVIVKLRDPDNLDDSSTQTNNDNNV